MKYLSLLTLFLFATISAICQQAEAQILGEWLCTHRIKCDGSKIFEPMSLNFQYRKISFFENSKANESENNVRTTNRTGLTYRLGSKILHIGDYPYSVELLTDDSLVLSDFAWNVDRLHTNCFKYFFVRKEDKVKEYLKNKTDTDTLVAPVFLEPYLNDSLSTELAKVLYLKTEFRDEEFDLHVDNINQELNITITSQDAKKYKKQIEKINNIIRYKYKDLQLGVLKDYRHIIIPLKSEKSFSYPSKSDRVSIVMSIFYNPKIPVIPPEKHPDYALFQDKAKNAQIQLKKGNLRKALNYFIESYNANEYDVQTMINIAEVYDQLGEKENACIWWGKLRKLEQVYGIEKYDNNCKNR